MVIYLEWWKVKGLTAGERIMQLRTDRKYTREQLACLADISEQFLYEIEMNKKGFSADTLMKLSHALEVSMRFLQSAFVGAMEKNNIAQEYIDGMISITSGFMPVVIIVAGLLGGLIGGYIGQKALKKHFIKAGLVSVK